MFGKQREDSQPNRPAASDVARIQGGGLAQVIVTSVRPITYYLFLNDKEVPQADVESLFVSVEVPEDGNADRATVNATLSYKASTVTGEKALQQRELFPCTLEIVGLGRRICIVCPEDDSLEGLWITLGMKPDGSSSDVQGAQALQILLNNSILDAKLTWNDGESEELLPAAAQL